MNPKVDNYIIKAKKWQEELSLLRKIVLVCGLSEELKWGVPCYEFDKRNIVLIHAFKDYCALLFHKGVLLNDLDGILIKQTENVQSGRQIRFTNSKDIIEKETILKAYIFEAIELEKLGLKVEMKKTEDFHVPEEFQRMLDENSELKTSFEALTPGRQKGYLLHFSGAKQSKTRESRINESLSKIFKGKGLHDCTCGLSKRMPNCDGSHKILI